VALYALVGVYVKSKIVDGTLKALKARNLSRVRRPTGLITLSPVALSYSSGDLAAAPRASGGLNHQEGASGLQSVAC